MNAKELIEAAKDVLERQGGHHIHDVCNHILSTVRPDDDEPVTESSCIAVFGSPYYNEWGDAVWHIRENQRAPRLIVGCLCGTVTLVWGTDAIDLPDDLTIGRLRDILRGLGLLVQK